MVRSFVAYEGGVHAYDEEQDEPREEGEPRLADTLTEGLLSDHGCPRAAFIETLRR